MENFETPIQIPARPLDKCVADRSVVTWPQLKPVPKAGGNKCHRSQTRHPRQSRWNACSCSLYKQPDTLVAKNNQEPTEDLKLRISTYARHKPPSSRRETRPTALPPIPPKLPDVTRSGQRRSEALTHLNLLRGNQLPRYRLGGKYEPSLPVAER